MAVFLTCNFELASFPGSLSTASNGKLGEGLGMRLLYTISLALFQAFPTSNTKQEKLLT